MQTNSDSWPVDGAAKLHIFRRFPDHWATVKAMFEDNEEFRLLCNEYCLASDTLSRMDGPLDSKASMMRDEYMEIILELETEIRNYIDGYTLSVYSSVK